MADSPVALFGPDRARSRTTRKDANLDATTWALWLRLHLLRPCPLGLTLAHVLEIPGKRYLSGADWLRVQQSFYLGYAIVGAIAEVGGLLASLGIVVIERRERMSTIWPVVSAAGFAGMLGSYWLGNRPLNDRIASWTAQTLPADWSTVRDRWDTAHSVSATFAALDLASLLTQVLPERPPRIASSRLEGATG